MLLSDMTKVIIVATVELSLLMNFELHKKLNNFGEVLQEFKTA
jgi:hypothetical protein